MGIWSLAQARASLFDIVKSTWRREDAPLAHSRAPAAKTCDSQTGIELADMLTTEMGFVKEKVLI